MRPQHDLGRLVRECPLHRAAIAVVASHLAAVVTNEVDRLLHLAHRLHPGFADLEQRRHGEIPLACLDALRHALDDRHPRFPAKLAPCRVRGMRGRDGCIHRVV